MRSIPPNRRSAFVRLTTVLSVDLELLLFDGDLPSAAVQGVACGLAVGFVLTHSG